MKRIMLIASFSLLAVLMGWFAANFQITAQAPEPLRLMIMIEEKVFADDGTLLLTTLKTKQLDGFGGWSETRYIISTNPEEKSVTVHTGGGVQKAGDPFMVEYHPQYKLKVALAASNRLVYPRSNCDEEHNERNASRDKKILGIPTQAYEVYNRAITRWVAPSLGCAMLEEQMSHHDGKKYTKLATNVVVGGSSTQSMWAAVDLSDYREVWPSEIVHAYGLATPNPEMWPVDPGEWDATNQQHELSRLELAGVISLDQKKALKEAFNKAFATTPQAQGFLDPSGLPQDLGSVNAYHALRKEYGLPEVMTIRPLPLPRAAERN